MDWTVIKGGEIGKAAKILMWNVNGLNSHRKRNTIQHWLKNQECEIVYLQETYIKRKDVRLLQCDKLGMEFVAAEKRKKGGGSCLIN